MRQIISVLLALTLMVGASPVFAFGEEVTSEAPPAAAEPAAEQDEPVATEPAVKAEPVKAKEEKTEIGTVVLTIFDAKNNKVLDEYEQDLEDDMTIKELLQEIDREKKLEFDWEKCEYIVNDKEIKDIDIEKYIPEDGDEIIINEPAKADEVVLPDDADMQDEPAPAGEEELLEVLIVSDDDLADAYSKTAGSLTKTADKSGWIFSSEWTVLGLARSGGVTEKETEKYCQKIASYVAGKKSAQLSKSLSTDNSRLIIALTSLGYDATDVSGYNLLEPLADMDFVNKQGLSGPVFALIALDTHNYEIPTVAAGKTQTTREALLETILTSRKQGKGWAYSGDNPDTDMTCMVIQALAPYYGKGNKDVDDAVNSALDWLSTVQNADGLFVAGAYDASSETQSQVIAALVSLGIDPDKDARFVKNGNSAVDALMSFKVKNGGFRHNNSQASANTLASQQAYYALTSLYRLRAGKTSLYDMSDIAALKKFTAKGGKDDEGGGDEEDQTGGKATGHTRSLGFLSLGLGGKKGDSLIKETGMDGSDASEATAAEVAYQIEKQKEQAALMSAMPWVYGAIAAAAALALVFVIRKRNSEE